MITISIDVLLLDKKRFKEVVKRNSQKAIYAELILIPTPTSDYGDYIVKQSVTKEERAARVELPILGNGRQIHKGGGTSLKHTNPNDGDGEPMEKADVPF